MTQPSGSTTNTPSDINRPYTDGCSALEQRNRLGGNPKESARRLYRSMNTYDIAQLLNVRESDVFNLVFGHRAQTLRSKP